MKKGATDCGQRANSGESGEQTFPEVEQKSWPHSEL